MKRTISLLLILTLSTLMLSAEDGASEETKINYEFPFTHNGIEMFMEDLNAYEPENYDLLLPQFEKIETKRTKSLKTGITIGAIGLGLMAGGSALFTYNMFNMGNISLSPGDSSNYDGTPALAGYALMAAGSVAIMGGFGTYIYLSPKEGDYYRLVNTYNRHNPDNQINIKRSIILE